MKRITPPENSGALHIAFYWLWSTFRDDDMYLIFKFVTPYFGHIKYYSAWGKTAVEGITPRKQGRVLASTKSQEQSKAPFKWRIGHMVLSLI